MAHNGIAAVRGTRKERLAFSTGINFSGFIARWLWRTIYLSKLPGFEKKLRVAFDWTLDLIFWKDPVQFLDVLTPMISRPEAEPVTRGI